MIRLFELNNGKPTPTEHCYIIKWLKVIIDEYPENNVDVFAYIFYMTYPGQENPFYNFPEDIKDDMIKDALAEKDENGELKPLSFDTENDYVIEAVEKAERMYETLSARATKSLKVMTDNLLAYMETAEITVGRDGNMSTLISAGKNFEAIRESYKKAAMDLEAEQSTMVRGGQVLSYDQEQ